MSRLKLKYKKIVLLSLLITFCLTGCDKQIIFYSFQSIPGEGWKQQDTLTFQPSITDTALVYKVNIDIRNGNNYPYSELNFLLTQEKSDSLLSLDSLHISLANSKGDWTGIGLGNLYQTSTTISSKYRILKDSCTLNIIHLMPDTLLRGIYDLGIKIEKL